MEGTLILVMVSCTEPPSAILMLYNAVLDTMTEYNVAALYTDIF